MTLQKTLHRSVTSKRRVSFTEWADGTAGQAPVQFSMPKQAWIDMGRPERLSVSAEPEEQS